MPVGFYGIGAQKAGTTWLSAMLRQHPQVWIPDIKEVHYFTREVAAGRGDDWYEAQFAAGAGKTTGDITPAYATLEMPAIDHAHRIAPNAKLLFCVRHPVERVWSNIVMHGAKTGRHNSQEEWLRLARGGW